MPYSHIIVRVKVKELCEYLFHSNYSNMKNLCILVLIFWTLSGLYFGIGGLVRANLDETLSDLDKNKEKLIKEKISITYDGVELENIYELQTFLEINSIENLFPWAIRLSSFMSLLITSFAFGLIGSIIGLIKEIAFQEKLVEELKIWSMPILGMLTGLVVLGLSYLFPAILTKDASGLQPITLMFFSLFAGMFTKNFYAKLSDNFNKMLS